MEKKMANSILDTEPRRCLLPDRIIREHQGKGVSLLFQVVFVSEEVSAEI